METTTMMYSTERVSKVNVSQEVDQAFMAELKRTDRPRFDRLVKTMETHAVRLQQQSEVIKETVERRCKHCNLVLASDKRIDARFCDRTCERNAKRVRAAIKQSQTVTDGVVGGANPSIGVDFSVS